MVNIMIIRLGYVSISKTLEPLTTSSTYTVTQFEKEKDYQKLENIIDEMTREFSDASLKRMRAGQCQRGASVVYAEILVDFERIGDYALNIAQALKVL